MQFKRWAAHTGKVAEFLQNQQNQPVLQNEAEELEIQYPPREKSHLPFLQLKGHFLTSQIFILKHRDVKSLDKLVVYDQFSAL